MCEPNEEEQGQACRGGLIRQFKGIENFLKRVAFNLGNTPSQTEVKIISCIPIDVSDLQQKIIFLEKQLDDKGGPAPETQRCIDNVVCTCDMKSTAKRKPIYTAPDERGLVYTPPHPETHGDRLAECYKTPRAPRKSTVSFQTPCQFGFIPHSKKYHMRYVQVRPFDKRAVYVPGEMRSKNRKSYRRNRFHYKNKKHKRDYVYYSQTSTSCPLNRSKATLNRPKKHKVRSNSYLSNVINKQFFPKPLGEMTSDISKFSSPICRDTQNGSCNCFDMSDTCSCFRKNFNNLDDDLIKLNKMYMVNQVPGGYYDATLYDVFPVKEKTNKIKKPLDISKNRVFKPPTCSKCLPEELSTSFSNNSISKSKPYLSSTLTERKTRPTFKKSSKINRRSMNLKDFSKNNISQVGDHKVTNNKISTNKTVELGHVKLKTDAECLAKCISKSECLTTTKNGLQTEKTEFMLGQIKNILQTVLQEIKITTFAKGREDKQNKNEGVQKELPSNGVQNSIPQNLPTNLASTKQHDLPGNVVTNNHESRPIDKERKPPNVVVNNMQELYEWNAPQYGLNNAGTTKKNTPNPLQGNVFGFGSPQPAYNIYTANTFLPYTVGLNSGHYCPSPKYFPNFPIFFQPAMRVKYSNSCEPYPQNGECSKQVFTVATNTDGAKRERSKETEQLIKDIYKTMAINMEVMHLDNALKDYKPVHNYVNHVQKLAKKESKNILPAKEVKKVTNVVQAVSELFRKSDYITSLTTDTTPEQPMFNKQNAQHETIISSTEKLRKERLQKFLNQAKTPNVVKHRQRKELSHEQEITGRVHQIKETLSSTDSEFDATYTQELPKEKRKLKNYIFNKVFNTVKMFKPKTIKRRESLKVESDVIGVFSSDSDDYQTVYSKKIKIVPKLKSKARLMKNKASSKLTNKNPPYMEQEYRRHWMEKLMFDDNKFRHRSNVSVVAATTPASKTVIASPTMQRSPKLTHSPPVYCRIYETRTACVQGRGTKKNPYYNKLLLDKQTEPQTSSKMEARRMQNGITLFKKSKNSTNTTYNSIIKPPYT